MATRLIETANSNESLGDDKSALSLRYAECPSLTWTDIVLRLMLTMAAADLIGLDREAGGHNAGLRITLFVGLAAAVAMVQANLLQNVHLDEL